ncbi:hypothetical protein CERSUDRAFT_75996 [Gelatoporia subvermispora B]|uniref:DUF6532 domain-containing protein n=1 Tax=Ceriporiopsis subvermispora (strain B) TaxID=914234 RepID=M2R729_CERS8|nr:hypothetical protein CERSUDRAFT_75996 [Gelatoporia subvermispora B]
MYDVLDPEFQPDEQAHLLIITRAYQVREDLKKAARALVPAHYGLKPVQKRDPNAELTKQQNRAVVAHLLEDVTFAHPPEQQCGIMLGVGCSGNRIRPPRFVGVRKRTVRDRDFCKNTEVLRPTLRDSAGTSGYSSARRAGFSSDLRIEF